MINEFRWPGSSIWQLISFLYANGGLGSHWLFRGQSNASWNLVPALFRRRLNVYGDKHQHAKYYLEAEERMLKAFFNRAITLLPNFSRHPIADRVLAQHFGVPTQLLDWTADPFVGIFFAVEEAGPEIDGALYFVSPLASLANDSDLKLPFQGRISSIRPPIIDERVKMQKSVFTIQNFGTGETFEPINHRNLNYSLPFEGTDPRDEVDAIGKVTIPYEYKAQLRYDLLLLGVDSSLLFPGLQGIGLRIAAQSDFGVSSDYY